MQCTLDLVLSDDKIFECRSSFDQEHSVFIQAFNLSGTSDPAIVPLHHTVEDAGDLF